MEFVDATALSVVLGAITLTALAGFLVLAFALAKALPITRRERLDRHESIPTYYGRMHFVP